MSGKSKSFIKLLIITLLILPGCSSPIGEFFSTRYENVMGYFNTYYNVKKTYDEALEELYRNPPKSLDTNYFAQYTANQSVKNKFNIVIEKCSKIIQNYPRSKWVDDAIMMIGKTYYYQNDNELALRKFSELFENFPSSSHYWEANLFYAKSLYNKQSYDQAVNFLTKFLERALQDGEENIALEGYMLIGQIYYEQGDFDKAENAYLKGVEIKGDKNVRAQAFFYQARNYERLENYQRASRSYYNAFDYTSDFNLEFKAKLKYAITLTEIGSYELSLEVLDDLKGEKLIPEFLSQAELEIANTYKAMGKYEKALNQYEMVDSLFKRTDAAAKSFYQRGLLYEEEYKDFPEAKFYYDRAKTENQQSDIYPFALKKSEALGKYIHYQEEIRKYDSLFYFAIKQDSLRRATPIINEENVEKTDSDKNIVLEKIDSSKIENINISEETRVDTLLIAQDKSSFKQNEDINNIISQKEEMNDGISQKEDMKDSVSQEEDIEDGVSQEEEKQLEQHQKNQSALQLQSPVFQINITPDSALYEITKNQFETATLFLLDLSLPDSAEFWFNLVLKSKHRDEFAPSVYYALAEIQRIKKNDAGMDSIYNLLINEYGDSKYAIQAKKNKGLSVGISKHELEILYEKGIKLVEENKPKEALKIFRNIYSTDTSLTYSSKALYTIGWIYENMLLNNDSAKTYYKNLIDNYPKTRYAEVVEGKVAVSNDTTSLSKYVKFNEIIAPPPPVAKSGPPERITSKEKDQQTTPRGMRDPRDDEEDDEPDYDYDDEDPDKD